MEANAANGRIRSALSKLESRRRELLELLSHWKEQDQRTRPLPDKWSALEILEHLVLSERDVMKGVFDPDWRPSRARTLRDRVSYWAVVGVLKSPLRVSVPSEALLPSGAREFAELRSDWLECQHAIRRFVEGHGESGGTRIVSEHPIAGPMTLFEAIRMARVHAELHIGQVERLDRLLR